MNWMATAVQSNHVSHVSFAFVERHMMTSDQCVRVRDQVRDGGRRIMWLIGKFVTQADELQTFGPLVCNSSGRVADL